MLSALPGELAGAWESQISVAERGSLSEANYWGLSLCAGSCMLKIRRCPDNLC
jgi:hypothetical protein